MTVRSDMSSGARDTAITFATRVAVMAASLGTQSALAWLLGPDGRGSYAVCMLFAMVLGMVFTLSVDRGAQYLAASGRVSAGDCVLSALVAALVGSVIGMIAGYFLIGSGLEFFAKAPRGSFMVALLLVPLNALADAFIQLFMGMRRFSWMGRISVVRVAVHMVATLILVWGFGRGVSGAIIALMIGDVIAIAVAFMLLRRESVLTGSRVRLAHCRSMLSYGSRYWIANLSNQVHFRIGTIVLAWFATASDIGIFAAASGLVARVLMVPDAVEGALLSRVAVDPSGRPRLVAQVARVSAIICGAGLVVVVLFSRPIVEILFSKSFLMAVPLIWVMAVGIFIRSGSKVIMPYFMGVNRPQVCSWAIGTAVIVNLAAIMVLLPRVGLVGAAWAMTAGYATSAAILMAAFRSATGLGLARTWLPRREDLALIGELLRRNVAYLRRA
ncbi:MAG: oligosaccharide flippase family protein [Candidatus Eisenbacteria bacterium]|nr:oligosaccharide flippase family protein [Candidatus Eisenbacteria bacterium]